MQKKTKTKQTMIVIYIIIYISPGDDAVAPTSITTCFFFFSAQLFDSNSIPDRNVKKPWKQTSIKSPNDNLKKKKLRNRI